MKHIPEVNLDELKDYLKEFILDFDNPQTSIPIIWSKPGIGKSCLVSELADELKATLIPFYASTADETEITGIPVPNEKEGFVRFLPLEHQKFPEKKPVIWFWDEINRARPEVIQALFSIISSYPRRIGTRVIPNNVYIVCAANFGGDGNVGDSTIVTDFNDSSFFNKFSHISVRFDKKTFFGYLIKKYEKTNLATAVQNVTSFLDGQPDNLIIHIPDDPEREKAYPTPRTIERFIKTFGKILDNFSTEDAYLKKLRWGSSIVGEKWVDEYISFGKEKLMNDGGAFDYNVMFKPVTNEQKEKTKKIIDALASSRILRIADKIAIWFEKNTDAEISSKLQKNNWFLILYFFCKMPKDSARPILSKMLLRKPVANVLSDVYEQSDKEYQEIADRLQAQM